MKTNHAVQADGGGAVRTFIGHLCGCLAGPNRWRHARRHLLESGRSLLAFGFGLLLATLYGVVSLFVQKQPLWFCFYTTQTLAALVAFGMGLSTDIRASIMVVLPSLLSNYGRKFLLFLYFSLLWSGPVANTMDNIERTSASLLCGAELAANQTQELMQRAATPLFASLDKIREIGRNALSAAGRIQNFIDTLSDSARHVARTLRNVLHFLADIGDICNEKLGTPYRKCLALFSEARGDCEELLGEFNFLCDIVGVFQPLCELARVGELFCTIPSYVAQHLRERLGAPVVAAFAQMKREFDFNFSASVSYDVDANSSRSLQEITQDIMSEVSSQMVVFQTLGKPMAYGGFVLLILSLLRAVQYRRSYLRDLNFDNIYITGQLEELDRRVTSQGGASILPITPREAKTYLSAFSFHLTAKERRLVLQDVVSIFRHLLMGSMLVALDFLVFWMLDQVCHLVKEDVVARAPVLVTMAVNGTGYASDIFRDLVASFNILQGGNITVISKKCLLTPSEPDQATCFTLGFLLGLALLLSLTRGFVQRCRRLVCAHYYPDRELSRIQHLRLQILEQRETVGTALRRAAARFRADGGAAAAASGLRDLLLRLPAGGHLCRLLALSPVSCLSCGEVLRKEANMAACDDPQCPGIYCRPCFHSLGNICLVCVRPELEDAEEEECDSSDDCAAHLPPRAVGQRGEAMMMVTVTTAGRQQSPVGGEDEEDVDSTDEEWSSDDSYSYFDSIYSVRGVNLHDP